ncbi:hypothetical protein DL93DRAFT_2087719 [Clavulina sp. PMI_390]|nr:hypothetical protein DL93DRAFT_2087719 [Clavulina sp. PMI_390]
MSSLEWWLALSQTTKEFQVLGPDVDYDGLRAADFRPGDEFTRSSAVTTSRQAIQAVHNTLQEKIFGSVLW